MKSGTKSSIKSKWDYFMRFTQNSMAIEGYFVPEKIARAALRAAKRNVVSGETVRRWRELLTT